MSEVNPNLSPAVTHQPSLLGGAENMKLLFDDTMADISHNRKQLMRHADAWETLRLKAAQNLEFSTHLVNVNAAASGQTGTTEGQASVTPIRTGAADAQNQQPAGAVYPPIRNVDQTSATANGAVNAAIAQIAAQVAALTNTVTNLANALTPVDVNAAGGASTPSQTQPKPAA